MNNPPPIAEPTDPLEVPMSAGQRRVVIGLAVAAVVLGIVVEVRSAATGRRMTDLDCYLRGAWAVRVGADPYAVEDDNNWHYNYPPFLAILLGPIADPPAGAEPVAALPFAWSVMVWFVAGVAALVFAAHWLAAAVEAGLPRPPRRYGYAWWSLRLGPALLVMPAAARTLARGQVNTIVLFLLAGWIAGVVTGKRARAGLFLAFAACIKVIPAYLFLHTLWRRDLRGLLGGAIGLTIGLVALPVAVSGPKEALQQAHTFLDVTLRPGVGAVGSDMSRHDELTSGIATDSQSIMRVVHNLRHPHPWFRPLAVDRSTLVIHWAAACVLTLLTLAVAGRGAPTPRGEVQFIGALMVVMAVISPVCHLHYFTFALPLVTALWAGPRPRWLIAIFGVFLLSHVASLFHVEWSRDLPAKFLREFGITTVTTLALWAAALVLPPKAKKVGRCLGVDPVNRVQLGENTSACRPAARAA
jgi:hypothetical protein